MDSLKKTVKTWHQHYPQSNSTAGNVVRLQVDYASSNYCSLEPLASSRDEEQATDD